MGETVPDGMLVLLGDNRADSVDSRLLGYCPATSVVAVVAHGRTPSGRAATSLTVRTVIHGDDRSTTGTVGVPRDGP